MRKRILLVFCLFALQRVHANEIELENLKWEWKVFSERSERLVPFYKNKTTRAVHFDLEVRKFKDAYFKLDCPENYFLWIENQLVYESRKGQAKYFSLDSINQIYGKSKISVTLYSDEFDASVIATLIINLKDNTSNRDEKSLIQKRVSTLTQDQFIVISLITLLLIAFFRTLNYRLFKEYFSIRAALQVRQNFDLITAHSPLAWPNIGFIAFYALLVGSVAMNIELFSSKFSTGSIHNLNYLRVDNGIINISDSITVSKRLDESDEEILQLMILELRERFNSNSKTILSNKAFEHWQEEIDIVVPQIGDKKKLVELSFKNALYQKKEALSQAEKTKQKRK